jgi:hypothetical protein
VPRKDAGEGLGLHGYPGIPWNLLGRRFKGFRRFQMASVDTAGLMHQFELFPTRLSIVFSKELMGTMDSNGFPLGFP